MTLRAPGAEPPIVLLFADTDVDTPFCPFPRAAVPLASVPMRLPCRRMAVAVAPLRKMRSNSALLTDAYASPLHAQHGAAKRER